MSRSAACARRLASLLEVCSTSYSTPAAPQGLRRGVAAAAAATSAAATAATKTSARALPIAVAAAAARRAATNWGGSFAAPSSRSMIHTSPLSCDLREFLDEQPLPGQDLPTYGRGWKAAELRLKSWDDLHQLWYASLKERNLLETRLLWLARLEPNPALRAAEREAFAKRRKEVKLTMNRIKQVLSERARQELHPRRSAEMRRVIHLM